MTGCDEAAAAWAARRLGVASFGLCSAFALFSDADEPCGAIVFHNYHPDYRSVEVSIATTTPRWATSGIIRRTLGYAFDHLGCNRISAFTPRKAASARRLLNKLGFKREGLVRKGFGTDDAVISGLLAREWRAGRWGPVDGQEHPKRA